MRQRSTDGPRILEGSRQLEDCPVCKGAGWLIDRTDGPRNTKLMLCTNRDCSVGREILERRLEALFGQTAIPTMFRGAQVVDFAGQQWLVDEVTAARAEGKGLLLVGPCGVGKTHLAVAVLLARLQEGRSTLFINVPELLTTIKATYNREATVGEAEVLCAVQDVECLILDDLGVETDSSWTREKLYQVINKRYEWQRETLATSNLNTRDLAANHRLGERIVSRLVGMSRVVAMDGSDRRLQD